MSEHDAVGYVATALSAVAAYRTGDRLRTKRLLDSIPEDQRTEAVLVAADLPLTGLAKALGTSVQNVADRLICDLSMSMEVDDDE